MIKIYTGIKGFAVFLFFIAGVVLFLPIFLLGILPAIAMRFYSQWSLNLNPKGREKRDIIDVDAVEVRDISK
jgi:hypothetical protein